MTATIDDVLAGRKRWHVEHADCLAVARSLPDASVDAIVTDPPSGIGFMGKAWDRDKGGRDQWIAWLAEIMREALRALKPGAHALVWTLPRTSHWTATAVENAGFEIRDVGVHLFGTGFPKSLNGPWGGTALKPAAEHWILARKPLAGTVAATFAAHGTGGLNVDGCRIAAAADDDGVTRCRVSPMGYHGASGAVHVAPGVAGRWPANVVLAHADGCEPSGTREVVSRGGNDSGDADGITTRGMGSLGRATGHGNAIEGTKYMRHETVEAWRCVDGCPVAALDEQSGERKSGVAVLRNGGGGLIFGQARGFTEQPRPDEGYADTGGASRFFFTAKPSTAEREAGTEHLPKRAASDIVDREEGSAGTKSPRAGAGRTSDGRANFHPTVKPIDLMRWLCRLVTPAGGIVFDPFTGSGTTGCAAMLEGLRFVGAEMTDEYLPIAQARIAHWLRVHEEETAQVPLFGKGAA